MAHTAEKLNDAQLTQVAETSYESQKQDFVDEFKGRLKNSIEKGMGQVENGEHAPFDEAYKNELRSLV